MGAASARVIVEVFVGSVQTRSRTPSMSASQVRGDALHCEARVETKWKQQSPDCAGFISGTGQIKRHLLADGNMHDMRLLAHPIEHEHTAVGRYVEVIDDWAGPQLRQRALLAAAQIDRPKFLV